MRWQRKITTGLAARAPARPRLVLRAAVYHYGVRTVGWACTKGITCKRSLVSQVWLVTATGVFETREERRHRSRLDVMLLLRDGQCCVKASCFGASSVPRTAHAQTLQGGFYEPSNPPRQYSQSWTCMLGKPRTEHSTPRNSNYARQQQLLHMGLEWICATA